MQQFKNSKPLVSIIIPVYNSKEFLEKTIRSVTAQTYTNWELILVNDGSDDGSELIMESFKEKDERIKCIHFNRCTGGPALPRNEALKISKGEYISFLDSDDLWEPSKLEEQFKLIKSEQNSIIFGISKVVDANDTFIGYLGRKFLFRFLKIFFKSSTIFLFYNPVVLSSSFFKRNNIVKFRADKSLQSIEDWAFWIDLTLDGYTPVFMDKILSSYRLHKNSMSFVNGKKQFKRGFVLYSNLFMENKIGSFMFVFLFLLNFLRLLRFFLFGRQINL